MDANQIVALVEGQIAQIEQRDLVRIVRQYLVPPRLEDRDWDYGKPGQRFPVWLVWEHAPSETVVGYCENGFGPAMPWGLLDRRSETSLGMDSQWYTYLEDAIRASCAWTGENPPGYEVR